MRDTACLRVLVLDDEPVILMDLCYAIEDAGHEAAAATTADGALGLLCAGRIDTAVLDVNLGNGSTCAPVVAWLIEAGIPYILHTGDLDRHGELVRDLGGELLPKPAPSAIVAARAAALAA